MEPVRVNILPSQFRSFAQIANVGDTNDTEAIDSQYEAEQSLALCLASGQSCASLEELLLHSGFAINSQARRYVLIINGDVDAMTYSRHQTNVENAVRRFKAEGFDGIYVVSPDFAEEAVFGFEPNRLNIENAVNQIKANLRAGDSLVIYTTGHGSIESSGEASLDLPDARLTQSEFEDILGDLSQYNVALIMDQCFGGRWVETFSRENMYFVANTASTETGLCEDFSSAIFIPQDGDLNADGIISLEEMTQAATKRVNGSGMTVSVGANYIDRGFGAIAGRAPFPAGTVEINNLADLERELAEHPLAVTVLYFWAEWCGACGEIEPRLEDLAEQYGGLVRFIKVDRDSGEEIAAKYGVDGVPFFVILQGDRELAIHSGGNLERLSQYIDLALQGQNPLLIISTDEIMQRFRDSSSEEERREGVLALRRVAVDEVPGVLDFVFNEALTDRVALRVRSGAGNVIATMASSIALAGIRVLIGLSTINLEIRLNIISKLIETLINTEAGRGRLPIVSALEDIGRFFPDEVVPMIAELLEMDEFNVYAFRILGELGVKAESALPLLFSLIHDPNLGSEVLRSIGDIGRDETVIEGLIAIAQKSRELRNEAVSALGNIARRIRGSNPKILTIMVDPLLHFLEGLRADRKRREEEVRKVLGALRELGSLASPAISQISWFLHSDDQGERIAALSSLVTLGENSASVASEMLLLIVDPKEPVRRNARHLIAFWAFMNKDKAVQIFTEASSDVNQNMSAYANLVLRLLEYETLYKAAGSEDEEVRALARDVFTFRDKEMVGLHKLP